VTQEERGGDAYARAGVDIAAGNALVQRIGPLAAATARPGTMGGLGGFGAGFDLAAEDYTDPLLVAATDGVGTKLLLAEALGRHDTLGIDLVAMCVNDLVVQGAEPLFFLDYLATGKLELEAATALVTGIAKGSGMVAPDLATMLAFVFTDAAVPAPVLQALLERGCDRSFNATTVDGDTSTSDTLLLAATGQADHPAVDDHRDRRLADFRRALDAVLIDLAQQVVRDGEGAQKFVEIAVRGAVSNPSARRIGLSIANSPLVKTAIAGEDANWGRIVMAVGKAGEPADRDRLGIAIGGVPITEHGQIVPGYDERPVARHMRGRDIAIAVDIGLGRGRATVWTCDLTHGYISINADYRS